MVACLSHSTNGHRSLSRQSTVPTPYRDNSNIWAHVLQSPPCFAFYGHHLLFPFPSVSIVSSFLRGGWGGKEGRRRWGGRGGGRRVDRPHTSFTRSAARQAKDKKHVRQVLAGLVVVGRFVGFLVSCLPGAQNFLHAFPMDAQRACVYAGAIETCVRLWLGC